MSEEEAHFKSDISELKTNVSYIREEMYDMKKTITGSVEKISNSMTVLATVTEKLNQNIEDHKLISEKINDIKKSQNDHDGRLDEHNIKLNELSNMHKDCQERLKREEENKKNSIFNRVKDKFIEYILIILLTLSVYVLFSHFKDFISYMNSTGNVNPVQVKP